jgi:hypothetical protein
MRDKVFVFWQGDLPINFPSSPKILFAGLAPGLVGIEQIEPHITPFQLGVSVQLNDSGSAAADFPVQP